MIDRLEIIQKRYDEINELLMQEENIKDTNKSTELLKEQASITDIVSLYNDYKLILEEIKKTKEVLLDDDLKEMAEEELIELENEKIDIESQLEILLLPKDPNDGKNVIIEIRGAAGGDEANIFAGDLYKMYTRYAEKMHWRVEELHSIEGSSGGYSQIEVMIKGKNVYSRLKYESGSHRVQRVPTTESQGRVHTSTATVLVMPEAEDVDIDIKENDIKIDVYRSSGAGGQSVNTTDSAVRITYLPTNLVVTCQSERSQIKNREKALKLLKTKIFDELNRKHEESLGKERKMKIGTGDRSEKIRTYNFPQNRVTDHRINLTIMQLDRIVEGDLDQIIEALITENIRRQLEE
ncbi:MAG: peptide chain release factor 1 [Bacilli bacterium]|nr:peptide chain release factor 1 [Bacilli bacterium]